MENPVCDQLNLFNAGARNRILNLKQRLVKLSNGDRDPSEGRQDGLNIQFKVVEERLFHLKTVSDTNHAFITDAFAVLLQDLAAETRRRKALHSQTLDSVAEAASSLETTFIHEKEAKSKAFEKLQRLVRQRAEALSERLGALGSGRGDDRRGEPPSLPAQVEQLKNAASKSMQERNARYEDAVRACEVRVSRLRGNLSKELEKRQELASSMRAEVEKSFYQMQAVLQAENSARDSVLRQLLDLLEEGVAGLEVAAQGGAAAALGSSSNQGAGGERLGSAGGFGRPGTAERPLRFLATPPVDDVARASPGQSEATPQILEASLALPAGPHEFQECDSSSFAQWNSPESRRASAGASEAGDDDSSCRDEVRFAKLPEPPPVAVSPGFGFRNLWPQSPPGEDDRGGTPASAWGGSAPSDASLGTLAYAATGGDWRHSSGGRAGGHSAAEWTPGHPSEGADRGGRHRWSAAKGLASDSGAFTLRQLSSDTGDGWAESQGYGEDLACLSSAMRFYSAGAGQSGDRSARPKSPGASAGSPVSDGGIDSFVW
eukprot:CAMPEP_0177586138 /NCGR_PEP_ID=MMETSP0419_2-20121207/4903_1 /TAXON_ID=582737 /ORGANISM="Tetraselmis sp., Strain GSL018" /LENGTH=545 /DNA_ID=CAMNT_0019075991 /DNA_START=104 /DNA_END=1738 /DNA_ORIENTATION=+